jgi:hypothetical protein
MSGGALSSIFVLRNESLGVWRGYRNEEAVRKEVDNVGARVVAVAKYRGRHLVELEITQRDDPATGCLVIVTDLTSKRP